MTGEFNSQNGDFRSDDEQEQLLQEENKEGDLNTGAAEYEKEAAQLASGRRNSEGRHNYPTPSDLGSESVAGAYNPVEASLSL